MQKNILKNKNQIVFLIFIAIGAMLLCTKSSPLYPYNDWGDANIYFTMGKGMLNGQVPYRDLYDHKGPLIYMLYAIAGLINKDSFLGVWTLEIIAAFFYLYYSYKCLCLVEDKNVIAIMPIYAAVVYASNHMRHGGSAEELCLPFLAYGMYILTKYLITNEKFSTKELIFVGITSGCVLWTKYTMLGVYIGWIMVPAIIMVRKKDWKELIRTISVIALGVMIATIPICVYFVVHSALNDLFTVYFYNNIFVYASEKVTVLEKAFQTIWNVLYVATKNIYIFSLIALGLMFSFAKKKYSLFIALLCCVMCQIMTTLTAPTVHGYYSMCFSVFGVFGIGLIWMLFKKYYGKFMGIISYVIMLAFIFINGYNIEFLMLDKDAMPQYQFAQIINQSESPTLLNYGFLDHGFYTVSGVDPICKFFFEANIDLKEMKNEQKVMVDKGQVEYIVTFDEKYDWLQYEIIAESKFTVEGNEVTYYLYRLK